MLLILGLFDRDDIFGNHTVQQLREAFPFSSALSDLRPGQEIGLRVGRLRQLHYVISEAHTRNPFLM